MTLIILNVLLKIINDLHTSKESQQDDIPAKTIKYNKDLFSCFISLRLKLQAWIKGTITEIIHVATFTSLGFDAVHRQTDKNINNNKAFILKSFFYQHMQVQLILKLKN